MEPFKPSAAFVFAAALLAATSCVTYRIPKDYVPDGKVVFLMQNTGFDPIRYPALPADPYSFEPSASTIDAQNPKFLRLARFDGLLDPDYRADTLLAREAEAHFRYMLDLPLFLRLKSRLDSLRIAPPDPLPLEKGEKIQDFVNGAEYAYPPAEGAKISMLDSGIAVIRFPDGSTFQSQPDGLYFWNDAAGKTVQEYDPASGLILAKLGDAAVSAKGSFRSYADPEGKLEYNSSGDPQYTLFATEPGSPPYTYFTDPERNVISCSVKNAAGIRFDYFPAERHLLVVQGDQAVSIDSSFAKTHSRFDAKTHRTADIRSVYLPQGIRLKDLDSGSIQSSDLKPAWPESYRLRRIGPFDVWYAEKDAALLEKISAARLSEIEARARELSGLGGAARRTIVVPPDLDAYRKLHARGAGDAMNWYPSGFESLDYITLWPVSVPRYAAPAGQEYFYAQEIYEIIVHEYAHLLVGENAGLLSPVPVWLNEGLAVYVEGRCFPDAQAYWETTFAVSLGTGRLLPWDDAALKSTGEYPIEEARVEYAQSYALVSRLIEAYGAAKVADYVRSFSVKPADAESVDLAAEYKENYRKVFGVDWDGGKALFSKGK